MFARVWFFFFQAEDGIRVWSVTGVQTCALPISLPVLPAVIGVRTAADNSRHRRSRARGRIADEGGAAQPPSRSEERRVGKECRTGWAGYQEKKETRERWGRHVYHGDGGMDGWRV